MHTNIHLPKRLLRVKVVLELTGLTRSSLYNEISRGNFPKPVKLTAKAVAWPSDEVANWINTRIESSREDLSARDFKNHGENVMTQQSAINNPKQVGLATRSQFSQKNYLDNSKGVTELKTKPNKKLNQSSDLSSREKQSPAEHFSPGEV